MLLARLRWALEWLMRALILLAVAMALAPLLTACASVPPCPVPSVLAYETPQGVLYLLDEENMGKVVQRMEGLKDGTCLGLAPSGALPEGARPS